MQMPLSEREQRLLEEMERNLYHHDADVVSAGSASRLRPNYRAMVLGALLALLGIGALIAGVVLRQALIGALGFVLVLAGVSIALRPSKVERTGSADRGPANASSASSGSQAGQSTTFMDRINDRWNRRQDL